MHIKRDMHGVCKYYIDKHACLNDGECWLKIIHAR